MNWVVVGFPWALWMSKHFWLHLRAHCFWSGFAGEVGSTYVNNKAETNWIDLFSASWEAWLLKRLWVLLLSLTTGFQLWPGFQTSDFTNIHIAAKGNPAKAPLHTCTDTNPAATPSQASKRGLCQGTVGCCAPLFTAEFLAFPTCTEHVLLVVGGLYLWDTICRLSNGEWQFLDKKNWCLRLR